MTHGWIDFVPRDWESPEWRRAFYPEDLPADWRLAYFANEFPALLLRPPTWLAAGERLEELAEQVPEGFRIYLELPESGRQGPLWEAPGGRLGARLAGLLAVGAPHELQGDAPRFLLADRRAPGWGRACLAPAGPPGGLRAQRAWLETLAEESPGETVLVIVEEASAQALRRWWELAFLMGLA